MSVGKVGCIALQDFLHALVLEEGEEDEGIKKMCQKVCLQFLMARDYSLEDAMEIANRVSLMESPRGKKRRRVEVVHCIHSILTGVSQQELLQASSSPLALTTES
eukprot:6586051-Ditylum_brightwellii.AAC.1